MRVTLERSGGFAGITLNKTLDAGSLSADESHHLQALLAAARFFELPELIPSEPQPDRFQYRIVIEQDGKAHGVTLSEQALSRELKTLVEWLMKSAHPAK